MIYYFSPYSTEKKLGKHYNQCMQIIPNENDFACFVDGDAMFTTPDYGHQIEEIISKYSWCNIFTAVTNRISREEQCIEGMYNEVNIKKHLLKGLELQTKNRLDCCKMDKLLSGVLILIKKKTWLKIGKFTEEGILGVDNDINKKAINHNESVLVMQGVYILHNYRMLSNNKTHLKNDLIIKPINFDKIAYYTAIIGAYDDFQDPKYVDENADYHLFTDQDIKSKVYTIHKIESPKTQRQCILKAREIKILFYKFLPNYRRVVWYDANIIPIKDFNVLLQKQKNSFMTMKHPLRNCVYEEASACISRKKDDIKVINNQIEKYKKEEYPENNGMISSGILIRHNTKEVNKLCLDWFKELRLNSIRDQLSFNYVLSKNNINIELFPYDLLNDYFTFNKHAKSNSN